MNARSLLPALFIFIACEKDIVTYVDCPSTCYDAPKETMGVGLCVSGTPVCMNGVIESCDGQVLPMSETCDGLDNDCDGIVDEDVHAGTLTCFDALREGTCRYGIPSCINGSLGCTMNKPSAETCNMIDDDCDGIVDNVPATELCYEGDIHDLVPFVSACRAGVKLCRQGSYICDGQVLPSSESCDGLDNDCNGVIDDVPDALPANDVDVLIVVDQSGSMIDKIDAITGSLLEFITQNEGSDYRYAIVLVTPSSIVSVPMLALDFTTDLSLVRQTVRSFNHNGHGTEPCYDAFVGSVDGSLGVTWKSNSSSRALLWYGDEDGQSLNGLTATDAAHALKQAGVVFYGFIALEHTGSYEPIARATGGNLYDVRASRATMTLDLTNVTRICEQ